MAIRMIPLNIEEYFVVAALLVAPCKFEGCVLFGGGGSVAKESDHLADVVSVLFDFFRGQACSAP